MMRMKPRGEQIAGCKPEGHQRNDKTGRDRISAVRSTPFLAGLNIGNNEQCNSRGNLGMPGCVDKDGNGFVNFREFLVLISVEIVDENSVEASCRGLTLRCILLQPASIPFHLSSPKARNAHFLWSNSLLQTRNYSSLYTRISGDGSYPELTGTIHLGWGKPYSAGSCISLAKTGPKQAGLWS